MSDEVERMPWVWRRSIKMLFFFWVFLIGSSIADFQGQETESYIMLYISVAWLIAADIVAAIEDLGELAE